jgi:gliding motility-associated-like protein
MVLSSPQLNAGPDLQIPEGQTEQLNAGGADLYYWSPASGLSNANIPNPYLSLPMGVDSITYLLTGKMYNGCSRTDSLTIHVAVAPFAGAPTAFTPNGDGRNDVFKPIVKGLYQLVDFTVYNRWGQIVFQTEEPGRGWDGTINRMASVTGVYVWALRARNKTNGEVLYKKGIVALIK